jgi:hypothetical protein
VVGWEGRGRGGIAASSFYFIVCLGRCASEQRAMRFAVSVVRWGKKNQAGGEMPYQCKKTNKLSAK